MASNQFISAIIGSTQSKYSAIAISITILIICLAMLFMESDVPYSKRLLGILFIIIMAIPGIILALVEITCIVTGGSWNGKNWWCALLAWIIAVFVIVYCVAIIIATVNSIVTYKDASKKVKEFNISKTLSKDEANDFAEKVLETTAPPVRPPQPPNMPPQQNNIPRVPQPLNTPLSGNNEFFSEYQSIENFNNKKNFKR